MDVGAEIWRGLARTPTLTLYAGGYLGGLKLGTHKVVMDVGAMLVCGLA
jgi:hypothetical protein